MKIKKLNIIYLLLFVLMMNGTATFAQPSSDTSFVKIKLPLIQFLSLVGKQNLDYQAQKYNVSISEAGIESAKVFPDPELSFGAFDNQNASKKLGYGYNAGLSTTLELGGKRRSRIDLAKSQVELNKAMLEDFFRNLRADASLAYYTAIQNFYIFQVQKNSWENMDKLAKADSIRFKLGAITETDARQSKLESGTLRNTLFQNEADWKTALVQLNLLTGKAHADTLFIPSGDFDKLDRGYLLGNLIANAQNNRADLVVALNTKTAAEKSLQLVKANRTIDLGINLGGTYNAAATNEIAPTPAYRSLNAGLSIPLKFSNHYKGDIKAAQYTIKQSAVQYDQVLLQIQTEVTQSWMNYKAAQQQATQFKNGLLTEAQKVLDGKIYSYKRGETSLLEVLNAQRTYNDVQQNYYQSLFNYASALITLERSAGIWDLQ
ncbi:TolC family protein [Mucilaginibacter gossypii]|uniref:TolC family protein n=1 Tax=Mucilaginibacter gossypii TaxID=551996 RepID=UPI00167837DE|nr:MULTISPECIES: TolC family protein [Mucilaginibacter]QTE39738.1 TolC family protein [Mucilaginibacter gossypii]